MKTYTGPTLGGAVATIQCPDWCITDHAYWDDRVDDCFHGSDAVELDPPRDRDRYVGAPTFPMLSSEIRLHSTEKAPAAASLWLHVGDSSEALQLDLDGVNTLLARLDTYRAGVADLRQKLAAAENERRRR
ncbi:hypothetical protein PUR59_26120 [Streptomyces sp. SP18ES09]|uniref:DUF6907 domain-containing protein n=1 Tax=Streptomyces sp. SP18ES09 TaxID=3002532 RepID=UPI002E798783|nr:hypothetical protein [Streptomyces sp. SP18ES09]MEE1818483.1 hypothetical protein [Streptomyces sp. SP18ES09]